MLSFWVTDVMHLNSVCYAKSVSLPHDQVKLYLLFFFFAALSPKKLVNKLILTKFKLPVFRLGNTCVSSMF